MLKIPQLDHLAICLSCFASYINSINFPKLINLNGLTNGSYPWYLLASRVQFNISVFQEIQSLGYQPKVDLRKSYIVVYSDHEVVLASKLVH